MTCISGSGGYIKVVDTAKYIQHPANTSLLCDIAMIGTRLLVNLAGWLKLVTVYFFFLL